MTRRLTRASPARCSGTVYEPAPSTRRNVRVELDGELYDSLLEARWAWCLKQMAKAGDVRTIERQVTLPARANGVLICKRRVDFRVTYVDGRVELHECKGRREEAYVVRQKALEATYLAEHPEVRFREITDRDIPPMARAAVRAL